MSSTEMHLPATGERAAAISNLVVRLLSEYTGRGPTRSRTYITDDLVTVVLRDTLTKGERSLVKGGKQDQVLSIRLSFHETMRTDLIAGVEEIVGRKVRAFVSGNHIEPDIAVETFLLEDDATPGP